MHATGKLMGFYQTTRDERVRGPMLSTTPQQALENTNATLIIQQRKQTQHIHIHTARPTPNPIIHPSHSPRPQTPPQPPEAVPLPAAHGKNPMSTIDIIAGLELRQSERVAPFGFAGPVRPRSIVLPAVKLLLGSSQIRPGQSHAE
ncbi:hypothetical protein LTR66_009274, partial [Elasticomyces elasticus]